MRRLERPEIDALLNLDVVARLATIDSDGYPHVTPIWFLWESGRFHLTSFSTRPHLRRIARNPKVGLVIDIEGELRTDGERPNRQVRVIGDASIAERAVDQQRSLIVVTPRDIVGVASV